MSLRIQAAAKARRADWWIDGQGTRSKRKYEVMHVQPAHFRLPFALGDRESPHLSYTGGARAPGEDLEDERPALGRRRDDGVPPPQQRASDAGPVVSQSAADRSNTRISRLRV